MLSGFMLEEFARSGWLPPPLTLGWGRYCWVVEHSLSWLLGFRRVGVRYERRAEMLQSLLHLACSLICIRFFNQAVSP